MSDAGSDEPTQRLPRREEPGIPSDVAADMLQPTVPAPGPGRTTPPTMPLPSASAGPSDARRTAPPRPILGDRYELLEELGRGGMGVVYRAHDKTLGRDVALKVLQVAGRVDAETLGRFEREARAAAALDHPNIVRVYDVGALPDGAPYYTMEMLTGQDLAHAITDGHISPKEAVEAVRQVSLALLYAHQKGILHRDLKPQNIFLRRDPESDAKSDAPTMPAGTPKAGGEVHALLLDFGLAKLALPATRRSWRTSQPSASPLPLPKPRAHRVPRATSLPPRPRTSRSAPARRSPRSATRPRSHCSNASRQASRRAGSTRTTSPAVSLWARARRTPSPGSPPQSGRMRRTTRWSA